MGTEHRPQLQFDDQASAEPWPIELDYGDAEEEEAYEEESASASFGSLMSMNIGKPRKRPVLEVDPEELARANRQFELNGAEILDHTAERPAAAHGRIALDPLLGPEAEFAVEMEVEEEAFDEELEAETIAEDAEDLRPEMAVRLDAMLGLGAESVTAEYDDEEGAAVLPPLTGTASRKHKQPLFVHTDEGHATGGAEPGAGHLEEAAHLPGWPEPADEGEAPESEWPDGTAADHGDHPHAEPASPAGIWDPPDEEFSEPQWPAESAWPDLYPEEDETAGGDAVPPEPHEAAEPDSAIHFEEPAAVEPLPGPFAEEALPDIGPETGPETGPDIGAGFELDAADTAENLVLARMDRPTAHSSVRARLVREAKPRTSLWQDCCRAAVFLYRLITGRR